MIPGKCSFAIADVRRRLVLIVAVFLYILYSAAVCSICILYVFCHFSQDGGARYDANFAFWGASWSFGGVLWFWKGRCPVRVGGSRDSALLCSVSTCVDIQLDWSLHWKHSDWGWPWPVDGLVQSPGAHTADRSWTGCVSSIVDASTVHSESLPQSRPFLPLLAASKRQTWSSLAPSRWAPAAQTQTACRLPQRCRLLWLLRLRQPTDAPSLQRSSACHNY